MIKSERSMEAIRMKERLEAIRERALAQINETDSLDKLNDIRVAFLGKKGELTEVLKGMKEVAPEDRPKVGQIVNGLRIIHPEIPPYLIVYDYEHRSHLKEKFIELIRNNNLNDIPEKKYGFHIFLCERFFLIMLNHRGKENVLIQK